MSDCNETSRTGGDLSELPIQRALPALRTALAGHASAVLTAPPGSGKTTGVPLALLDAPWLAGRRILLLEPRRMAARAACWRLADLLGEPAGRTVGFHMRLERCFTRETRILVLTEGLLTRRLLADPELADVGLVIFDEFHERSLHADFGLALALDVQRALRPDLRLLVMSATLDAAPVARYLGGPAVPVVSAEGRQYPVETRYVPRPARERIADATAAGIRRALAEQGGSVLAFLPGEGEIRATAEVLSAAMEPGTVVMPLYAALPKADQEAALRPAPAGRRKVVLATSIAESSLTIEGISAVVDSGWARVSRFSSATGMSRLETVRITRDRADQRRGRAGRLGPGVCYRLGTASDDAQRDPFLPPELLSADLAPVVLQMADWGCATPDALTWLTPPPLAAWDQAVVLLHALEALDAAGRITAHGRRMVRLGMHPRLAHALIGAAATGDDETVDTACLLAAVLAEGGVVGGRHSSNIAHVIGEVESPRGGVPAPVRSRIRTLADTWRRALDAPPPPSAGGVSLGVLLAWAYPDRIGVRRRQADEAGRYRLSGGRGVRLQPGDPLSVHDWICVAEVDDTDADATVRLAAPLTRQEVETHFAGQIRTETVLAWQARSRSVEACSRDCLGAIVLRERPLADPDPDAVRRALCAGIRQEGLDRLGWTPAARNLQARVQTVAAAMPESGFPDCSDAALIDRLEDWLGPLLTGMRRLDEAAAVDVQAALTAWLGGAIRRLDALAPTHMAVPSGSRIRIDYTGAQPAASVRIQEVFGLTRTPSIAGGRVPVLLNLLSPASRPVQITADLESFWRNGYAEVRKDLRGRYPRHHWPDDPTTAVATRRLRPPG